jgi:hypothetical protein
MNTCLETIINCRRNIASTWPNRAVGQAENTNLEPLQEHVDVVLLVVSELLHELRVLEEGDDMAGGCVQRLEPRKHLSMACDHVGGDVIDVMERLVDVHGIVDHVGGIEEENLCLDDLLILVDPSLLLELRRHEHGHVVAPHGDSPRRASVRVFEVS